MSTSEQLNAMLEEMGINITIYEDRMFEPKIVIDTFRHDKQVRADAIDDCIQWIVSKFSYIDELDVPRIRCNASTIEINMKEQLMQKGTEG